MFFAINTKSDRTRPFADANIVLRPWAILPHAAGYYADKYSSAARWCSEIADRHHRPRLAALPSVRMGMLNLGAVVVYR